MSFSASEYIEHQLSAIFNARGSCKKDKNCPHWPYIYGWKKDCMVNITSSVEVSIVGLANPETEINHIRWSEHKSF